MRRRSKLSNKSNEIRKNYTIKSSLHKNNNRIMHEMAEKRGFEQNTQQSYWGDRNGHLRRLNEEIHSIYKLKGKDMLMRYT